MEWLVFAIIAILFGLIAKPMAEETMFTKSPERVAQRLWQRALQPHTEALDIWRQMPATDQRALIEILLERARIQFDTEKRGNFLFYTKQVVELAAIHFAQQQRQEPQQSWQQWLGAP